MGSIGKDYLEGKMLELGHERGVQVRQEVRESTEGILIKGSALGEGRVTGTHGIVRGWE